MLGFFRRLINSRYGVVITLGFLAVIALAFAAGDVTGIAGNSGVLGSSAIKVGGEGVSTSDLRRSVDTQMRGIRREQPGTTVQQFLAAGGLESLIERTINSLAFFHFGEDQGMAVSRALIGSELQTYPAFQGPTGKFDQATYEQAIAQAGQTDAQVQLDIAREQMAQFLIAPTIGASQVSRQLATPFASLLLEKRAGQVAVIPALPASTLPSDADVAAWYKSHIAAYTIPERRVARYAIVNPAVVASRAAPTDADIQQAYQAAGTKYQARQVRDLTLVTVLDKSAADALAAKVRGGQDAAAAARTAGLEARTVSLLDKAALAQQTSPALADAAFAAADGGVVGPVKGAIGYVVGKVTKVTNLPGRTLQQARGELVAEVTQAKTAEALSNLQNRIDDALSENSNITEIAADQKLTLSATPAVLPNGVNPDAPGKPDPSLAPIVQAAFAAEEGDTPTLVPVGSDGSFAVVALDRVVRPTPVPLDKVRARAAQDLALDRARNAAKLAAEQVAAAVRKGTALPAALAATKAQGRVQPVDVTRAQLNADRNGPSPVLATLFSMTQGSTKTMVAPDGKAWLVIRLDKVTPGDASGRPEVVGATRADLGKLVGQEYVRQFANAVANVVGVKRNADAIAQLKKDLAGTAGGE